MPGLHGRIFQAVPAWFTSLSFSLSPLVNFDNPGENILLPRLPAGFSHAAQCLRHHRCRAQPPPPPRHTILNIYEDQNDYQLKQKNGLDFSNFAPTSIINSNSYTVWQKMKVFLLHIFHTSIPEKNDRQDEALFIFFPYLLTLLPNISCLFLILIRGFWDPFYCGN